MKAKHNKEKRDWVAIALSVSVHAILLVGVLYSSMVGTGFLSFSTPDKTQPTVVKAKAIDNKALEKEVARLNQIEEAKQAKQARLEKRAKALAQKRKQEEQRIKSLAAKRLADEKKAKAKRVAEENRLKKIKQEAAAVEKKRQAEANRLAQIEKKLAEQKRQKAQEEARAEQKAKAERLAKIREQELAEKLAQERQEQERLAKLERQKIAKQKAAEEARVSQLVNEFGALVRQKVARNWVLQANQGEKYCILNVRLAPGGIVLDVSVAESSGDDAFDRSGIAAIYKASPLPVPENIKAFNRMRDLRLTLRPDDILSST